MALTTTLENRILQIEDKGVLFNPNNGTKQSLFCFGLVCATDLFALVLLLLGGYGRATDLFTRYSGYLFIRVARVCGQG
jgi:hypothetical protein